MKTLGILVSSKHNNIALIQDAIDKGVIEARIGLIVMSEAVPDVLELAQKHSIQTLSLSEEIYKDPVLADEIIVVQLQECECDLVYVDNYTKPVSTPIFQTFPLATIACHHSLLPAFGGEQCVEATYFSDVKITGITFHFVQDVFGLGPIIAQEPLRIDPDWNLEALAASLEDLASEHVIEVLKAYIEDRVLISEDGCTKIID